MSRKVQYFVVYALKGGLLDHSKTVPQSYSQTDEQAAAWGRMYCSENGKELRRVEKSTVEVVPHA